MEIITNTPLKTNPSMRLILFIIGIVVQIPLGCQSHIQNETKPPAELEPSAQILPIEALDTAIVPAANQFHKYVDFLKGKRLGLVVNHTSMVGQKHLVDTLLEMGFDIKKIFAPEHGFRGKADAGEKLKDGIDGRTNIPIVSLYGKNRKPSLEHFQDLDLVLFDIQDVGVRFYTYTSTMTYVMEACAENKLPLLILDRPNPNGHYVDGPVLEAAQKSFVGLHPVPIVHGLTVAEYALMINGEGWLEGGVQCELHHIECLNYNHNKFYKLPVPPSPNLPNMKSIYLYPSLCWFEGTTVSVGRGTTKQFQVFGQPSCTVGTYDFKPEPRDGARRPKHNGEQCKGYDLSQATLGNLQETSRLNLRYLVDFYKNLDKNKQAVFFNKNNFFDKLVGTDQLQKQLKEGKRVEMIQESWKANLDAYKKLRKKYLLYKDFE
ncbi:MAG: hypothetical protein ACI976_002256 [Aureispira sp.]|jgi:uncharacterized protein YbbC (DUF1343 family)